MQSRAEAILIADDNQSDIEELKRIMRETGVSNPLYVAYDGTQVIEYLSGKGEYGDRTRYPYPAFLFLDLVMPSQSGLEVLRWIRERPETRSRLLGIVAVIAIRNIGQVKEAYRLGANSFLVKPLRKEDLKNLIYGVKGIHLESDSEGS